jgi:hypothetical protein
LTLKLVLGRASKTTPVFLIALLFIYTIQFLIITKYRKLIKTSRILQSKIRESHPLSFKFMAQETLILF